MSNEINITIKLDHLIGKVEVTTHPSGESNLKYEHLQKQLQNLEKRLTETLLRSLQNAGLKFEAAPDQNSD